MGQMNPEGFTLKLSDLSQPKEGIMVSYGATQNSTDRKSIPAIIKHAKAHEGLVGGSFIPEDGTYYFDSTRPFPEECPG